MWRAMYPGCCYMSCVFSKYTSVFTGKFLRVRCVQSYFSRTPHIYVYFLVQLMHVIKCRKNIIVWLNIHVARKRWPPGWKSSVCWTHSPPLPLTLHGLLSSLSYIVVGQCYNLVAPGTVSYSHVRPSNGIWLLQNENGLAHLLVVVHQMSSFFCWWSGWSECWQHGGKPSTISLPTLHILHILQWYKLVENWQSFLLRPWSRRSFVIQLSHKDRGCVPVL